MDSLNNLIVNVNSIPNNCNNSLNKLISDNQTIIMAISSSRLDTNGLQAFFQYMMSDIYLLDKQVRSYCEELQNCILSAKIMSISPLIYAVPRLIVDDSTAFQKPQFARKLDKGGMIKSAALPILSKPSKLRQPATRQIRYPQKFVIMSEPELLAQEESLRQDFQYDKTTDDFEDEIVNDIKVKKNLEFSNNYNIFKSRSATEGLGSSKYKPNIKPIDNIKPKSTILKTKPIQTNFQNEIKLQASTFIPAVSALFLLNQNVMRPETPVNIVRETTFIGSKRAILRPSSQASIGGNGPELGSIPKPGAVGGAAMISKTLDDKRPTAIEPIVIPERSDNATSLKENRSTIIQEAPKSEQSALQKPGIASATTHIPLALGLLNSASISNSPKPAGLKQSMEIKGDNTLNSPYSDVSKYNSFVDVDNPKMLVDNNSKPIAFVSIKKPASVPQQRSGYILRSSSSSQLEENAGIDKKSNVMSAIDVLNQTMVNASLNSTDVLLPLKSFSNYPNRFVLPFQPEQFMTFANKIEYRQQKSLSKITIKGSGEKSKNITIELAQKPAPFLEISSEVLKMINPIGVYSNDNEILYNSIISKKPTSTHLNPPSKPPHETLTIENDRLHLNYQPNTSGGIRYPPKHALPPEISPPSSFSALELMGNVVTNALVLIHLFDNERVQVPFASKLENGVNIFTQLKRSVINPNNLKAQNNFVLKLQELQYGYDKSPDFSITKPNSTVHGNLDRPRVQDFSAPIYEKQQAPEILGDLEAEVLQLKTTVETMDYRLSKLAVLHSAAKRPKIRIWENNKLTSSFKKLVYDAWVEYFKSDSKRYGS